MQGNSFLGAFFRVSPVPADLRHHGGEIPGDACTKQYQKKFGRFGDAVVASNMTVMTEGFARVQEIKYGKSDDPDRSSMRNPPLAPAGRARRSIPTAGCGAACGSGIPTPAQQTPRYAVPDARRSSTPNSATASATTSQRARSPRSA